jgi:hypothetical protein
MPDQEIAVSHFSWYKGPLEMAMDLNRRRVKKEVDSRVVGL